MSKRLFVAINLPKTIKKNIYETLSGNIPNAAQPTSHSFPG